MKNDLDLNTVDELGMLQAQIADLTAKADAIKDAMKDIATRPGAGNKFEGAIFKATVVESNRSTVNYKKLMTDLGIDETILVDYTTVTAVFSVKVTSR
jgi:hypothetical protein